MYDKKQALEQPQMLFDEDGRAVFPDEWINPADMVGAEPDLPNR